MLLLLVLVASAFAEEAAEQRSCISLTGDRGYMVPCPDQYVVRSLCTSGVNADCGGYMTRLECCLYSSLSKEETQYTCETKSGVYGGNVECVGSKNVMRGACSSGRGGNCNGYHSQVLCCDDYNLDINYDDYEWQDTGYGVSAICGPGRVGCGMCSSGWYADCRSNDGNFYYTRLKCCAFNS